MKIFEGLYKVIYNYYVSKGEKDIPHGYSVLLISVLQLINGLSILMLLNIFELISCLDKSEVIIFSAVIMALNFIYFRKYRKDNFEEFPIEKIQIKIFVIYLLVSMVMLFALIAIHRMQINNTEKL